MTKSEYGEINIKVKKLSQLFNSLDASPFIDKDLDDDAVDYIVSSAKDFSLKKKLKLIIHLPKTRKNIMHQKTAEMAIHNFFEYMSDIEQKKIRHKFKDSVKILLTGLSFLAACLLLREGLLKYNSDFVVNFLGEGLVIIGWVAMWKPISDILYEWLPLKSMKNLYLKLAEIKIEFNFKF